jgi:uncharacterized protein
MTKAEQDLLLITARESILSRIENRAPRYSQPSPNLLELRGAFVTLHTNDRLRGCIGPLEASNPLFEAIKELGISSGFRDPRFPPLTAKELGDLNIEISVLSPLEKITSIEEIEVGSHGLYAKHGSRSGVLLPQVPVEQGWNREEFLGHTCRKAGLSQDEWRNGVVDFYTFTAEIFREEN